MCVCVCVCVWGGGDNVGSLLFGVVLCVFSTLAIILLRKRESWLLSFNCVVAVCVLGLFLTMPWVGLLSVIVAFPGHTHLLLERLDRK